MCKLYIQENTENVEESEEPQDMEYSNYIEEQISIYNNALDAIDADFLPQPLELIDYLLQKLGKYNSSLDILFDMQNFQQKTSILYVIEDFRECFALQGTANEIIEGYILDKLTQNNKLDLLDSCVNFYRDYKHIILTRLLN